MSRPPAGLRIVLLVVAVSILRVLLPFFGGSPVRAPPPKRLIVAEPQAVTVNESTAAKATEAAANAVERGSLKREQEEAHEDLKKNVSVVATTNANVVPKINSTKPITISSSQSIYIIMSAADENYKEKIITLAERISMFGTPLHIIPINWTSIPEQPRKSHPSGDGENRSEVLPYVLNNPMDQYTEILPAKLAAIDRTLMERPIGSQVLWIDADTIVLGDVSKIPKRSHANDCDISIRRRGGQCKNMRHEVIAAGVINVRVSEATRELFHHALHLSLEDKSCRFWHPKKGKLWFQDQLALLKALEQVPGSHKLTICELNHDEMYIGRPHVCGSPGNVTNETITFSGAKTAKIQQMEQQIMFRQKQ